MREMKDSGVEWIGKIPKDWEIVPLSLILLMADAGMIIPIGRMYLNTVKMAVFRQ